MTDEQMEARLRAAGEAWRTVNDRPTVTPTPAPLAVDSTSAPFAADTSPAPRRHRTALLASAAVVATALVAGGGFLLGRTSGDRNGVSNTDDAATLTGTTWRLVGYDGEQQQSNSTATLYVNRDGRLVADDACNLITGKADAAGGRLAVTDLDARSYRCTDSAGDVSFDRGIETLRARPQWSTSHGALTISGAGPTMNLVAADDLLPPTADRPTLTGANWQLTAVTDANGTAQPVYRAPTLSIDKGQLSTSDACNGISGRVHVEGETITPAGLGMTNKGCIPGLDTAVVIDAVFQGKMHATVAGATLTIARPGAGTLTYRWVPADEHATDPHRLTSTTWRLASLAGTPAGGNVTLRVAPDGTLVIHGCTELTGHAQVAPGTLTTSRLPADAPKGCPGEMSTLLSFLNSNPALWSIQQDHLLIYGGGAQAFSLVFDPADVASVHVDPADQLVGRSWKLTGVTVENGNSASGSGSSAGEPTLMLTDAGYTLMAGCGPSYRGTATISARAIAFGSPSEIGGPVPACADTWDRPTVLKVFDGTARWSVSGGQLTVENGNTTLTFER